MQIVFLRLIFENSCDMGYVSTYVEFKEHTQVFSPSAYTPSL